MKLNDTELYHIFIEARAGSKYDQKILIKSLREHTNYLRYTYLSRARKVGLCLKDLDDLIIDALFVLFNKSNVNIIPETFLNYFRYIYMRQIQNELRTKAKSRNYHFSEFQVSDSLINDDDSLIVFATSDQKEKPLLSFPIENELCEKILFENDALLSSKEREILGSYVLGQDLSEQADNLKLSKSTIYTHFYRGLDKVRDYMNMRY